MKTNIHLSSKKKKWERLYCQANSSSRHIVCSSLFLRFESLIRSLMRSTNDKTSKKVPDGSAFKWNKVHRLFCNENFLLCSECTNLSWYIFVHRHRSEWSIYQKSKTFTTNLLWLKKNVDTNKTNSWRKRLKSLNLHSPENRLWIYENQLVRRCRKGTAKANAKAKAHASF